MERSEARLDLSVVVPMFNEAGNLTLLVESIERALAGSGRSFEVLIVDDGSNDGSAEELDAAAASRPWLHPIHLIRNYGQSAALQAGFDHAGGRLVVTLDADLQNDPADIPRMVRILEEDDSVDVVAGWRRRRQDSA
jgi:glycosyltransferase involved in cell wall biosynthesis